MTINLFDKKYVFLFAMTILLVGLNVSQVNAAQSLEPVLVRAISANTDTREYSFKCDIPSTANPSRYWSIRPDTNELETSFYSSENTITYTLTKNVLYHIGCQVQNNSQNIRGDFHIDLRNGPNTLKPNIVANLTNGHDIMLTCTPPSGVTNFNMYWRMMNIRENIAMTQFDNKQVMTTSVPYGGLWDFDCGVWDKDRSQWHQWGYPVEFFDIGEAYVPSRTGCIPGEACGSTTPPPPPPPTNTSSNGSCYSSVELIPANCNGQITSDTYNGCRQVSCSIGANTLSINACNKPDMGPYNRFEMYKQAQAGSGVRICLGNNCMQDEGFIQSSGYPICLGNSTSPPTNTTTPPPTNTSNNTSNQTCYSSMQSIPANCTGGSVTTDSYNGCRNMICTSGGSSLQVQVCDKGSFFEMYKQSQSGTQVSKLCLANTCIADNGYAKSGNYPVCVGGSSSTPPPPPPPPVNNTCASNVHSVAATCNGGTISSDSSSGNCRTVQCTQGGNTLQVLACDKPDSGTKQYYEMYKQTDVGSLQICLGGTCITDNGYARSSNFPICSGNQRPNAPVWFEPVSGQPDVEPYHFNLHVDVMSDAESDPWAGTDYEMYDANTDELIWKANKIMNLHPRNGDGIFMGSLSGTDHLLFDRDYEVRARHHASSGGLVGTWSSFIPFHTRTESASSGGDWTWTAASGYKVELVAQDLNLPVTLEAAPNLYTHLPDGQRPKLYMTHLYGQIGVLLKNGNYVEYANNLLNYDEFGSLPGSGEIGVIGLYVDPTTGDLFVSMSYMQGTELRGKVDRFTTNNDGTGYTSVQTIVSGIPVSPAHQAQEITRGPDGFLYMGTGDADNPQTADDWSTLYGKILKFRDDGSNLQVYAAGLRNPYGHEWRPGTNQMFVSNNGEDSNDGIYKVLGGETFGWCQATCNTSIGTWALWRQSVVPTSIAFDAGTSGFPSDSTGDLYSVHVGPAYVPGELERGKRIVRIQLNSDGSYGSESPMVRYTGDGYGTPVGMIFMNDGLYFTDLFGEEGFVGYGETRGNIYRIVPGTQTVDPAPQPDGLSAAIGPARWYPQGLNMVWECHPSGGTGPYQYEFYFGDGQNQNTNSDNVWHTYPANGSYVAYCKIKDTSTGVWAQSDSTTLTLGSGSSSPPSGSMTATISGAQWYPQGRNHIWVCNANGGSGSYNYDFNFGDGQYQYATSQNNVYHTYASAGTYQATCTARDMTGQSATSSPAGVTV